MKIWQIIKKEMKSSFRNVGVTLIFTLMPLIMIVILGLTFAGDMDGEVFQMSDITVEYSTIGDETELSEGAAILLGDLLGEDSVLKEIDDIDVSMDRVKDAKVSCLVVIDEDDEVIRVYKNSIYNTESSLIEGVLGTYVTRFNAIMEIVEVNPRAMAGIDTEAQAQEYSRVESLGKRTDYNSMGYYGISMIALFVLYEILSPFSTVFQEKSESTGNRMLVSPLKKYEFFIGKLFGNMFVAIAQIGLVAVVSIVFLGVSWGSDPLLPFLLILTEIVMVMSIGICLGLIINKEGAANAIVHTLVVIFAFFGGAYVPIQQLGELSQFGRFFSPLWWIISGINSQIYLGETVILKQAFMICIVVSIVFFSISILKMRKMEGFEHV